MTDEMRLTISTWIIKPLTFLFFAYLYASSLKEILSYQQQPLALPIGLLCAAGMVMFPTKFFESALTPDADKTIVGVSAEMVGYGAGSLLFAGVELALVAARMSPSAGGFVNTPPSTFDYIIGYGAGLGVIALNLALAHMHAKLVHKTRESRDAATAEIKALRHERRTAIAKNVLAQLRLKLDDKLAAVRQWISDEAEDRRQQFGIGAERRKRRLDDAKADLDHERKRQKLKELHRELQLERERFEVERGQDEFRRERGAYFKETSTIIDVDDFQPRQRKPNFTVIEEA